MAADKMQTFAPLGDDVFARVSSVCIGTGRFLRTVLVPALVELGGEVVIAQTRGKSFGQYLMGRPDRTYEVDTVLRDGVVLTACYPVAASGTLGEPDGREAFMRLPAQLPRLRYVGLGVTEAGIAHNSRSLVDLAEFLHACFVAGCGPLSVINTDNMPFNGDAIQKHVLSCDFTQAAAQTEAFQKWLRECVRFHNTMVDCITSHRVGQTDVPRAEQLPAKALVVEDLTGVLPQQFGSVPGVVVRSTAGQLELDIALKLRIANGIHTSMVYAMALGGIYNTDGCIGHPDLLPYLEQLFERDIVHCCAELAMPRLQATSVFNEWMMRLQHPHFGLSCFFVCQNALQKLGIRLLPSVKATFQAGGEPSDFMVFALAVALRFLTPVSEQAKLNEVPPVFSGRLDSGAYAGEAPESWEYTPGLRASPRDGTYEFRDGDGLVPLLLRPLGRDGGCSVAAATSLAGEVLSRLDGFDARSVLEHGRLSARVGNMLQKMLSGEAALGLLASLRPQQAIYLDSCQVEEAVQQEVDAAEAIDVHTHLFSSGYGAPLMQYGIDAMLTYHYLVSEYLAGSVASEEEFYSLPLEKKAECVWTGLFVNASPVSEQCRGVLSTLSALGLWEAVADRDLQAIRLWYAGQTAEMFNKKMMRLARLRYVHTSHDPFEPLEAAGCLEPPRQPEGYRRVLSLDKLLEGNWGMVRQRLEAVGEQVTLRGLAAFVQRCAHALQPSFLTAATPHEFHYAATATAPNPDELDAPLSEQPPPSPQQVLDCVVLPFCRRSGLALSLRMGTRRGVNTAFGQMAGDGVGSARVESLGRLCAAHPKIKFLATVLSRSDQHELAVLAGRFRNLHICGCWWYCNNSSIVSEVTAMRLDMLGTGFTFQASSARVHDQLICKWIQSRALLARLLCARYAELLTTGWRLARGDIRRDVRRLLGDAFEEFMAKTL